ncbi:hypothetical protein EC957_000416 [Mortierella hygrophila]|uniref:IQ calmodulin-binding motif protein n=1 Tax=Mortierella hygrophila TaxID=979708 RepID=A0A9P6F630_9FUNG|nr:hypothetical protein EC957_000416 [Mortierella hygrophila]
MSTVHITPAQEETPSKAEPSQTLANSPTTSQPASNKNDHNLSHHNQGKSEHDTEHDKVAVEPTVTLTAANKSCVFAEPASGKEEKAAIVIQSVYRGYQARRDLYGSALTASQKWRYLIDHSRIELIHQRDAIDHQAQEGSTQASNDPNQHLWAWGSNGVSAEEALVLLTEHWLEMSDKKHRYGSNLKVYHEFWLAQDTSQNFFYWLDKGDGKEVDIEERPRARLDEQRVHYLQEYERAQYAVNVVDGLFYYKQSGQLVHTLPTSVKADDDVDVSQILPDANEHDDEATRLEKKRIRNKSKFIYVTDPQGVLYIAQKVKGQFHHSSFLGGGTVCAAGGIVVNRGKLIKINPKSGHYRPGQRHFDRLLSNLEAMGISLEDVKVSTGILEAEVDGDGNEPGREGSSDRLVMPLDKTDIVKNSK